MTISTDCPHLHDILGEAITSLPMQIATRIETALTIAHEDTTPANLGLLAELQRIRSVECTDGQPWPEDGLPPGRRMALARADRSTTGLLTLLEVLHAGERARVSGALQQPLGEGVMDGLLLACRGLAEHVEAQLRPG